MIKFVPEIYPEETAYSYLSRIRCHSGVFPETSFADEALGYRKECPDYNFLTPLSEQLGRIVESSVGIRVLALDHTVFKYYARSLPPERKKAAFEAMTSGGGKLHQLLSVSSLRPERSLRYCPMCAVEDRAAYGEAYFHVAHMIPEIVACPKHRCGLLDTKVANHQHQQRDFACLEELIGESNPIAAPAGESDAMISSYIYDVLSLPLDFDGAPVGPYLRSRLPEAFITPRGGQARLDELYEAVSRFYAGLSVFGLTKKRVAYVLRGIGFNVYDALLIARFEGLSPSEFADPSTTAESQARLFDEECKRLKASGLTVAEISRRTGAGRETVRKAVAGRYDHREKQGCKFRPEKRDWAKVDSDMRERFDSEIALSDARPLSKAEVAAAFGLRDKTLRSLPGLRHKIKEFNASLKAAE